MVETKEPKDLNLETLVREFDSEFRIKETIDPAMSRFVPMVYEPIGYNWQKEFEEDFTKHFNGLMIKPSENTKIKKVWLLTFLNDYMVEEILEKTTGNDMIFVHHPVQMESGDPRPNAKWGRGFLPIKPTILDTLKQKNICVYSCHAPLDAGSLSGLGTNEALIKRLKAKQINHYMEYGHGYAARICEVPKQKVKDLIKNIEIPHLDYLDIKGNQNLEREVTRIAILPGGGGNVKDFEPAEKLGAEVLISGQVTCRIKGERGEKSDAELQKFYPNTKMTLVGLSHAASEYPVMEDIAEWIINKYGIDAEAIPEKNWWR